MDNSETPDSIEGIAIIGMAGRFPVQKMLMIFGKTSAMVWNLFLFFRKKNLNLQALMSQYSTIQTM